MCSQSGRINRDRSSKDTSVQKVSVGVTGTFKPRIFDRVDFIEQKVLPAIGVG